MKMKSFFREENLLYVMQNIVITAALAIIIFYITGRPETTLEWIGYLALVSIAGLTYANIHHHEERAMKDHVIH